MDSEIKIRRQICLGCSHRNDQRRCTKMEPPTPIFAMAVSGFCRMGKFPVDLSGYDPETDPDSPRIGGCCDPPRE